MEWVKRNTRIPVPAIIRSAVSPDNAIGHEYLLLEYVRGECAADIYHKLDEVRKQYLVHQLIGFHHELFQHK